MLVRDLLVEPLTNQSMITRDNFIAHILGKSVSFFGPEGCENKVELVWLFPSPCLDALEEAITTCWMSQPLSEVLIVAVAGFCEPIDMGCQK